jgi:hypothetical protein
MGEERSSATPERETDQAIKDRQNEELAAERKERSDRLGHDIRDISEERPGPSKNDFEAAK